MRGPRTACSSASGQGASSTNYCARRARRHAWLKTPATMTRVDSCCILGRACKARQSEQRRLRKYCPRAGKQKREGIASEPTSTMGLAPKPKAEQSRLHCPCPTAGAINGERRRWARSLIRCETRPTHLGAPFAGFLPPSRTTRSASVRRTTHEGPCEKGKPVRRGMHPKERRTFSAAHVTD